MQVCKLPRRLGFVAEMETTYHGSRQRALPLSSLTGRALHRLRTGGTRRHPVLVTILFVGPNPFGRRDGTSGDPVDALDVAVGAAAECPLLNSLSDDALLALRQALDRAFTESDLDRLEKIGLANAKVPSGALRSGRLKEVLS